MYVQNVNCIILTLCKLEGQNNSRRCVCVHSICSPPLQFCRQEHYDRDSRRIPIPQSKERYEEIEIITCSNVVSFYIVYTTISDSLSSQICVSKRTGLLFIIQIQVCLTCLSCNGYLTSNTMPRSLGVSTRT